MHVQLDKDWEENSAGADSTSGCQECTDKSDQDKFDDLSGLECLVTLDKVVACLDFLCVFFSSEGDSDVGHCNSCAEDQTKKHEVWTVTWLDPNHRCLGAWASQDHADEQDEEHSHVDADLPPLQVCALFGDNLLKFLICLRLLI